MNTITIEKDAKELTFDLNNEKDKQVMKELNSILSREFGKDYMPYYPMPNKPFEPWFDYPKVTCNCKDEK